MNRAPLVTHKLVPLPVNSHSSGWHATLVQSNEVGSQLLHIPSAPVCPGCLSTCAHQWTPESQHRPLLGVCSRESLAGVTGARRPARQDCCTTPDTTHPHSVDAVLTHQPTLSALLPLTKASCRLFLINIMLVFQCYMVPFVFQPAWAGGIGWWGGAFCCTVLSLMLVS